MWGFSGLFTGLARHGPVERATPESTVESLHGKLAPFPLPGLDSAMFTTFRGGQSGGWQVTSITRVKGETLPKVAALPQVRQAKALKF